MNPKIHAGLMLRKVQGAQDDMSELEWLNSSTSVARVGKALYDTATNHQQIEAQRKQAAAEARLNQQLSELAALEARREEVLNHPLNQF